MGFAYPQVRQRGFKSAQLERRSTRMLARRGHGFIGLDAYARQLARTLVNVA
jgi:hypothetical protein